jgi:hypothetical protein
MYLSQTLARERHMSALTQAAEARRARRLTDLRRAERERERAELAVIDAWRRADKLRATFEE